MVGSGKKKIKTKQNSSPHYHHFIFFWTWLVMFHQKFPSLSALSNMCLCKISHIPRSVICSHKHVWKMARSLPLPLLASICPWVCQIFQAFFTHYVSYKFHLSLSDLENKCPLSPSRCLHAPSPIFLAFFYRVAFLSLPVIWNIIQPSSSSILTHDGWLFPWNIQHRVECRSRSVIVLDSLLKITLHKSVFIS